MKRDERPVESGDQNARDSRTDGPLSKLVDNQEEEAAPAPGTRDIPRQPETKHRGQDDYASGTAEHEDDREM